MREFWARFLGIVPQGLKPNLQELLTARLKPCPFKTEIHQNLSETSICW
jgi:hypothetical protein